MEKILAGGIPPQLESKYMLLALALLISLDVIGGFYNALREQKFSSSKHLDGMGRKFVFLVPVCCVSYIVAPFFPPVPGLNWSIPIGDMVTLSFCISEFSSFLKHAKNAGVNVGPLEFLADKSDQFIQARWLSYFPLLLEFLQTKAVPVTTTPPPPVPDYAQPQATTTTTTTVTVQPVPSTPPVTPVSPIFISNPNKDEITG